MLLEEVVYVFDIAGPRHVLRYKSPAIWNWFWFLLLLLLRLGWWAFEGVGRRSSSSKGGEGLLLLLGD